MRRKASRSAERGFFGFKKLEEHFFKGRVLLSFQKQWKLVVVFESLLELVPVVSLAEYLFEGILGGLSRFHHGTHQSTVFEGGTTRTCGATTR